MNHISENNLYKSIRNTVTEAQQKVYATVNFVMVETYWKIGKQIYEAQGENERAEYGAGLLKFLSEKLTEEFGKGFTVTNLRYMRQFYISFLNHHALRDKLSWTHYRLLLKVENATAREFYLTNAPNQIGVQGSLKGRSIAFIIKDCCPARTRMV
jgi:predicted nuclease of restriction endonuclease-like (RecB) superfamily